MATPSRKKRKKKRRKKHERSRSEGFKHHLDCFHNSKVPRKLGPIDIGRIKYKGTQYKNRDRTHFLDEKIPIHSRTTSFELRKRHNPVPKRPSLKEIGTPNFWEMPQFFQSESDLMKAEFALDFLQDNKPMHVRDKKLDKLQHAHVPKGKFAQEEQRPFSWKPIEHNLQIDTTHFLSEKFWYEASKIGIDPEFAHALQTLTPEKLIKIKDIPPPTGYDTKINYLNQLRQIVFDDHKQQHILSMSLSALQDEDEYEMNGDHTHEGRLLSPQVLNSPLNKLSEDDVEANADEFDKQMDAALEEILAAVSPSPQPPDDTEIDDALKEILARSPSPQPPEKKDKVEIENLNKCSELKRNRSAERRQLIKTIERNLHDIQCKNEKEENTEINALSLDTARNCKDWKVDDVDTRIDIDHIQKKYKAKNKNIHYTNTRNHANHLYKLDVLREKKPISINVMKPMKRSNDGRHKKYSNKIPSNYICAISQNIINEAVMASDGRIYDKINMETWLKTNDVSPVSGKRLRHKQLMPYSSLTNEIKAWKNVNAVKKRRRKRRRRSPVSNTKQKQWNHKLPSNTNIVSTSS